MSALILNNSEWTYCKYETLSNTIKNYFVVWILCSINVELYNKADSMTGDMFLGL
jgi:hypothetical protein